MRMRFSPTITSLRQIHGTMRETAGAPQPEVLHQCVYELAESES